MSSSPRNFNFRENRVQRIARNVTAGTISKHPTKGRDVTYLFTGRPTGQAAPTISQMQTEGFKGFQDNPEQEIISSSYAIDVYCFCNLENDRRDNGHLTVWAD